MPRTIPRMAGLVSVVIFGGLLGLLVFGGCQGEEAEQEPSVQPTHDILAGPTTIPLGTPRQDSPSLAEYRELPVPEALSSPALFPHEKNRKDLQVAMSLKVEYEQFACIDGSPRLLFRIPEPLPPGAMVYIRPIGERILESPGSGSYGRIDAAYESPIPSGVSAFQVDIASALANEGTKHLSVYLKAPGPSPSEKFASRGATIDVSGADCDAPR